MRKGNEKLTVSANSVFPRLGSIKTRKEETTASASNPDMLPGKVMRVCWILTHAQVSYFCKLQ